MSYVPNEFRPAFAPSRAPQGLAKAAGEIARAAADFNPFSVVTGRDGVLRGVETGLLIATAGLMAAMIGAIFNGL